MRDAVIATAAYAGLTLLFTWPLALRLTTVVASDLGDPIFNAWVLAWDASRMMLALTGHLSALTTYWHANIFYPHPYTLAYSDHQTAQALQILPVYAISHSPILSYNVAFLLTYVLSGLGMYLLVRELTGNRGAAFVAGLAFAFAPFRAGSLPHAQVLSSEWMPFAFFGFTRFFGTRRVRPLVGGAAAWVLQNLSCGYYLLFFSPFVPIYIAWELTRRQLWTNARVVAQVVAAGVVAGIATLPFVLPYLSLRSLGFAARPLWEVESYSADLLSFLTADDRLRVWGHTMRAFPHAEGWLFPGITVVVLALAGTIAAIAHGWQRPAREAVYVRTLKWLALLLAVMCAAMLFGWTLQSQLGPVPLKITRLGRTVTIFAVVLAVLLPLSAHARRVVAAWIREPAFVFVVITLLAGSLALGPSVHLRGDVISTPAPYWWLYQYVPGWDGLRVPARYGMIVAFALAALGGLGVAALDPRRGRRFVAAAAALLVIAESAAFPIPINGESDLYDRVGPAPGMVDASRVPAIYSSVAALPDTAVLLELPFGDNGLDIKYMLASTTHWRRLVNGYSGGFPPDYALLKTVLDDLLARPGAAADAMRGTGATHVVVHEAQFAADSGKRVTEWVRSLGASELASADGDRLFAMPQHASR